MTLPIKKTNSTLFYGTKNKKIYQRYGFLTFTRNLSDKHKKNIMDTATKIERDAAKTSSKKEVYKAAEATRELIGNKIAEKVVKLKPWCDENSQNVEEIIIPSEKRQGILNELRYVL